MCGVCIQYTTLPNSCNKYLTSNVFTASFLIRSIIPQIADKPLLHAMCYLKPLSMDCISITSEYSWSVEWPMNTRGSYMPRWH